jgi:uncharacterized phiE125 gp8 family phage protein
MSVEVITPPATVPVTLEQARHHCRIDFGDDDVYLVALVEAATLLAEKWLGRSLISQTLEMTLDGFPACPVPLRRPPIETMGSVKYDDPAFGEVTLDNSAYRLVDRPDAKLTLAYGVTAWPLSASGDAVRIRYTAGYGASGDAVPAAIRQAILLFVGHWFANRETVLVGQVPAELPIAAESLLSAYRVPVL